MSRCALGGGRCCPAQPGHPALRPARVAATERRASSSPVKRGPPLPGFHLMELRLIVSTMPHVARTCVLHSERARSARLVSARRCE